MTRKIQKIPNSLPAIIPLDCKKRAYAHLVSSGRRIVTMNSGRVK